MHELNYFQSVEQLICNQVRRYQQGVEFASNLLKLRKKSTSPYSSPFPSIPLILPFISRRFSRHLFGVFSATTMAIMITVRNTFDLAATNIDSNNFREFFSSRPAYSVGGKSRAGNRGRTGDVQLGNFLSYLLFSFFRARTYPTFSALKTFFRSLVISSSFKPSTFVLGTFWERALSKM